MAGTNRQHYGDEWPDDNRPGWHDEWPDDSRLGDGRHSAVFPPATRGRGRLLAGFTLGAATVLTVQFGAAAVTSPPVAVVAGTALPASGAAAAAAASPSPPPTVRAPAAPAARTPPPTSAAPPPSPPPQRPGTLRLPDGGTAALVRKDLGPGGELPIPEDLGQATWWGAELDAAGGASVFAGHVNWRGATGPFAELWTAGIDDVVTIVDSAGKTWRYRIAQLVTVHKNDLAARADDLFGQSGPHRVVLVTCGGRWVGGTYGYEENRVVIADPA
ncbi:class F sortase [Amycolatopsis sp. NPDC051045]|uniref:class F sortase n=1 Tax=Amycolatopsis sp. NPDC051045 TaxID=3156922 RepID=UPI003443DA9D